MGIADVVAKVKQAQAWQRMGTPMAGVGGGATPPPFTGVSATPPPFGSQNLIAQQIAARQAADANWAKLSQTPFSQMGQARAFTGPQAAAVERLLGQAGTSALPTLEAVGTQAAPKVAASVASPLAQRAGAFTATGLAPVAGMTTGGAGSQGLLAAARGQIGSVGRGIAANGWKGGIAPAALGLAGSVSGNLLDESQMLGGSESKANDTAAKALKWGGTGAGLGLMVGGPVGALIGGAAGGVIGVAHEGLERQGILGTRGQVQEQANTLINETNASAADIGLPGEVTSLLQAQYNAGMEFAKTDQEKLALAQDYAAKVQEHAMNYAANPDAYASSEQSSEAAAADMLVQRTMMMNAIKPYANNFLAQSSAEADMYQGMAAGAGNMAPMYEQMAANTRASGARQAMGVVQETQITPYQQALESQAGYLKQMSNSLVSQAMGQVMPGADAAAGSTDLTAIIDQYANSAQPE